MDFEVLMYNDTYAMYSYENNEIFGVEIINPKLAAMQKQIFDFMWRHSRRMKMVSEGGAAIVLENVTSQIHEGMVDGLCGTSQQVDN